MLSSATPLTTLPAGYIKIPACTFTPLPGSTLGNSPVSVDAFFMARTPVTNGQYGELARSLGPRRFALLNHDFKSGATTLVNSGATAAELVPAVSANDLKQTNFDRGAVLILGSQILVKMVDAPSAKYDDRRRTGRAFDAPRIFSAPDQPVIGVSYFHALAWCELMSLRSNGAHYFTLPTDVQYEYVASDRGTKRFGTETGRLWKNGMRSSRKLAHVDENNSGRGTTASVYYGRYTQNLPFGIQTTGNVDRWTRMNPAFRNAHNALLGAYGLRGGSWFNHRNHRALESLRSDLSFFGDDIGSPGHPARADSRRSKSPVMSSDLIGFQPVIVAQDSL